MNPSTPLLLCVLFVSHINAANAACHPHVIDQGLEFPSRAVSRGQQGTVFMDVLIADSGRAASVEVVDSSGYRLLDRAAAQSALTQWQFDISSCERKDLPVKHRIAVEYRNDQ